MDAHASYLDTPVELAGRKLFAPGAALRLPAAVLDAVIIPGDTVPVRLPVRSTAARQFWERHLGSGGALFGAVALPSGGLCPVGCTLEVRLRPDSLRGAVAAAPELQLVAVARQRCRIVRASPAADAGVPLVDLTVLADEPHSPPSAASWGSGVHPHFWRVHSPRWLCSRLWGAAVAAGVIPARHVARAAHLPLQTRWRATATDEAAFSFFVSRNLPVGVGARAALLAEDSVAARLRACLFALRSLADSLACVACRAVIVSSLAASRLPAFLNDEGMPVFSNPACITFRVVLVAQMAAEVARVVHFRGGAPELADSWFAGYAWSLLACAGCGAHIGWRYDWLGEGAGGALEAAGVARVAWDAGAGDWAAWAVPRGNAALEAPLVTASSTAQGSAPLSLAAAAAAASGLVRLPLREALASHPPPPGQPWTFYGLHGGAVAAPLAEAVGVESCASESPDCDAAELPVPVSTSLRDSES